MTKISQLSAGVDLDGDERFAAVQDGQTVYLTGDQIQAYFKARSPRTETDNTTLVLNDAFGVVEINAGTAKTVTVPQNASVAFKIGTQIRIGQIGSGQITIQGTGVTFKSPGNATKTRVQYSSAILEKRGTDDWVIGGDITT